MCLRFVPISSSAPPPLGAACISILLSEVEQEQRPSGNGEREAIVVGASLCDGGGERAYTRYAPHIIRNVPAYVFRLRFFGIFLPKRPPPCFCRNVRCRNVQNPKQLRAQVDLAVLQINILQPVHHSIKHEARGSVTLSKT